MKKWLVFLLLACVLCAAGCALAEETTAADRKVVYLTFDDGPKSDTLELLKILREENVPATFFFVGNKVRKFPEEARQVYLDGHKIASHSMKHSSKTLKVSQLYVEKDYREFLEVMREIVDPAFTTDIFRFPGGSTGYSRESHKWVRNAGLAWFDWNAMTADTEDGKTAQDLYDFAVKTTADEEVVILLAHEGIKRTQQILPDLIAFYRDNGYEFRTLSTSAEDRALYERCPANMMLPPMAEEQEESL